MQVFKICHSIFLEHLCFTEVSISLDEGQGGDEAH